MKYKILTAILGVLLLTACCGFSSNHNSNSSIQVEKSQEVKPNIYETGLSSACYSYIVDKNTGVVYLYYDGNNRAGLTVMVNTDGTPITADQLGISY